MTQHKIRCVSKQVAGKRAVDGAGVHLVRVLGHETTKDFDPFLMLDAFDSTNPDDYILGFPMHPHRGIETVTYLVEGKIDHKDSLGHVGHIMGGDCQWMTAGCGILHQEMPQASEKMLGLQLWVNMDAKDKMAPPKYRDIRAENIIAVKEKGATVKVLAGEYKGHKGAMQAEYVPVTFLDLSLDPGSVWEMDCHPEDTLFIYMFYGDCWAGPLLGSSTCGDGGGTAIKEHHAVLFDSGDRLLLSGGAQSSRLVIVAGKALDQPIAWAGPIVMNSEEELEQAFVELREGSFIRHA